MVHKRKDESKLKDEWETPPLLFQGIERFIGKKFTLDPCTSPSNPLGTPKFYTVKEDGLKQDWGGETVFVNPPYGSGSLEKWLKKASIEAAKHYTEIVMLLPSDTSTHWYRDWIFQDRGNIVHIIGRIKFVGAKGSPSFGSCLYLINLGVYEKLQIIHWDYLLGKTEDPLGR